MYLIDEIAVNLRWKIFCVFFLISYLNFFPMQIDFQAFFFTLDFVEDTFVEISFSIIDIAEFMDLFLVNWHTFSLEFTDLEKEKDTNEKTIQKNEVNDVSCILKFTYVSKEIQDVHILRVEIKCCSFFLFFILHNRVIFEEQYQIISLFMP